MANNKIQVRRTAVSGRTPNTTNSSNSQYISAGELALNMADRVLYTSDGTNLITVGANLSNLSVTNITGNNANIVNVNVSNNVTVKRITANGSPGISGQLLLSNGSSTYWGDLDNVNFGVNTPLTVRSTFGDGGAVNTQVNNVRGINFDQNSGIFVTDQGSGNVFVSLGSSFKTIQVPGQASVVAVAEDTLTLANGSGIIITTSNTAPKTITISSVAAIGASSIFDGGNPFSSYSGGPVIDAGGVL